METDGEFNVDYGKVKRMPHHKQVKNEKIEEFAKTMFSFVGVDELEVIEEDEMIELETIEEVDGLEIIEGDEMETIEAVI